MMSRTPTLGLFVLGLTLLGLACEGEVSPLIDALVPARGAVGATVDVLGEGFEEGDLGTASKGPAGPRFVSFGGTSAQVLFWQPQRVRVAVPEVTIGLTNVVVTVGGRPSGPRSFDVVP